MSFTSNSSKQRAQSTVLKLFSTFDSDASLMFNDQSTREKGTKSSTQLLSAKYEPSVSAYSRKRQENRRIKKKTEEDKKFRKMIKYNIIKSHADDPTQSLEEQKYLAKLRQRNINQINRLQAEEEVMEIGDVKESLAQKIGPPSKKRIRKRLMLSRPSADSLSIDEFNQKVEKGLISMPGLTPGLAPIDYNESDSE